MLYALSSQVKQACTEGTIVQQLQEKSNEVFTDSA